MSDDAKRITSAVLSAIQAGGDHLAIYQAVQGAIGAAQAASNPADEIIGQIEERFPDWRGFRDLVDCIDVTLHRLRGASPLPSADRRAPRELADREPDHGQYAPEITSTQRDSE